MDKKHLEIIDLRSNIRFVEQYVNLRNSYIELLLTESVTVSETKDWLNRENIEVRCIIENDVLTGAVILYLNKAGEITFFVKHPNRGSGSILLKIIEEVARERKLEFVWSWVLKDNIIAQRAFEKNGFIHDGLVEREYRGSVKQGVKYKKYLN